MSDKVFVDTNILIYAYDSDSLDKGNVARDWLGRLWQSHNGLLSIQVLQEFYINVTQKLASPVAKATAREVVRAYGVWVSGATTVETVLRATEMSELWQLSFWDSLIIAAAEQARATHLLSEDLNAGQIIAGIKIVNPFLL